MKKAVYFQARKFFNYPESFLYCLNSRIFNYAYKNSPLKRKGKLKWSKSKVILKGLRSKWYTIFLCLNASVVVLPHSFISPLLTFSFSGCDLLAFWFGSPGLLLLSILSKFHRCWAKAPSVEEVLNSACMVSLVTLFSPNETYLETRRILQNQEKVELRQYKNDSTEPKIRLVLKLPRFSFAYKVKEKA